MSEERKFGPASPEVIEQLLSQSPIDHNLMKTFSDRILGCAAWKFDFNYPFTMQIYKQENYQQMYIDLLKKYCPDKKVADIVASI